MIFKIVNKHKKDIHVGDTVSYYTANEGWVPFFITEIDYLHDKVYGREYGQDKILYLFDMHKLTSLFREDRLRKGVHSGFKDI